MTEAERDICKIYLEDLADLNKSHSCNEYKMLMGMLDAEPCKDTISRQAAKEAYCKHFCHRGVACPDTLCKEVNESFDELPSAQPEPKWIPCSERLPRDSSKKIVTFTSGYVSTASFVLREKIYCGRMLVSSRENFWQVLEEDEEEGEVVAWMPLPEPYKDGGAYGTD